MSAYSNNPENSLKRANEFRELGKHDEALTCLYDILKNRKNRLLKNVHENIIHNYLEICVDLKKSQAAKDGLYLYRSVCQGVNIKSWENSLYEYLQNAEVKTEHAKEISQATLFDSEALDLTVTPEHLLKYVSSEDAQDRTERIVLLPWVRFLWESYRICLELLRNPQMEKLFHKIAQRALAFCVKYSRKAELRKLCNLLRTHIAHIHKQVEMHFRIHDPEIQMLYLETGIFQLECAVQMELWLDAFKAIEDIHLFLSLTKKLLNSRIMAVYYEKVSLVFWKANDYLFHAAAVLRQFLLVRELKKNLPADEMSVMAARVVLAILSVPFAVDNPSVELIIETDDSVIHKKQRLLATLLDLPCRPTRSLLIKDLERHGIIHYTPAIVQKLFYTFEFNFLPLSLPSLIEQTSSLIDNDICFHNLKQYMLPVRDFAIIKLISDLSKVYKCITFTKLLSLLPAVDEYYFERLIVDSARRYNFSLKIDHNSKCLHFYNNMSIFRNKQNLECNETHKLFYDGNLNHLAIIHSSLIQINKCLSSQDIKIKSQKIRSKIVNNYIITRDTDHKKTLQRKKLIEKHKEAIENLRIRKEEEERKHHVQTQLKYIAAEKERLLKEAEERNVQRLLLQKEEIKRKIFLEKMEVLKQTQIGCQLIENLDFSNLDTLDPEVWLSKQIELFTRERKEFLSRLRRQEKTVDYIERAKRMEELPLLILEYEEEKITCREVWEQDERTRIETAHKERERDVKKREKILKVKKDLDDFILKVQKRHRDDYKKCMEDFLVILNSEKQKRMEQRALSRKVQRRIAWVENQSRILKQKKYKQSKVAINTSDQAVFLDNKNKLKTAESGLQAELRSKQSGQEEYVLNHAKNYYISKESEELKKISSEREKPQTSTEETSSIRDIRFKSKFHNETSKEQNTQSLYVLKRFEMLSDDNVRPRVYNYLRPRIFKLEKAKNVLTKDRSEDVQQRNLRYDDKTQQIQFSSFRAPIEKKNNTFPICEERVKNQDKLEWRRQNLESVDQSQRSASREKTNRCERTSFDSNERQKSVLRYSCTPWAKSSRKEGNA
ncbi:eukaryotic translation initiation factor 3 subunit A-like [Stegodyphus dumicola]|uniref:eukaryotic translation initiation factor 3 subunit A-like n=1 Tax=Stegodyphus dumicola TaxID=202533 RepID=UPI0015AF8F90|nr:eukaryotic translation initiation factor 3 subunit A-like [Stegodyphus dumicola]